MSGKFSTRWLFCSHPSSRGSETLCNFLGVNALYLQVATQLLCTHILLAEDNPHYIFFVQQAQKQVQQPVQLSMAQDGEQAVNFLFRVAPYSQVASPDFVLLDIKMPRKTGIEVLMELGRDVHVKWTTVIMFTGSDHDRDINRCYK